MIRAPILLAPSEGIAELRERCRGEAADDVVLIELDVGRISSDDELMDALAQAFAFPTTTRSFDAAEELMADLHWLSPVEATAIVLVVGLSALRDAASDLFDLLVGDLLPTVAELWTRDLDGGGRRFHVVLVGTDDVLEASHSLITRFNEEAEEDLGWEMSAPTPRPIAIDSW